MVELRRRKMKSLARQRTEIRNLGKLGRNKCINGQRLLGSIKQEVGKMKRGVRGGKG